MATQTPAGKRMRAANEKLRKAASHAKHSMSETLCKQCDPPVWVRRLDLENHRSNFHRPLGYMYERRKQREQAIAEAAKTQEKVAKDAEKAARTAPARPERPTNPAKAAPSKGDATVAQNGNGQAWPSTLSRNGNGTSSSGAGNQAAGATASMTEGIVEMFRTWAIQTPPSIPASRVDAQAAADMWRGIADALRARARAEQENNNMPGNVVEPLEQAAQVASQIGDQHMEVVRRIESRYGEVAEVLSRPDTPNATYLAEGR